MRYKYLLGGLSVLLIIAGSGTALLVHKHGAADADTMPVTQYKHLPTCLADAHLTIPSNDDTNIGYAATSRLIHVPAGTNFNTHLSAYDGNKTAGSLVYNGAYGSYNFTAHKISNAPLSYVSWQLDSFTRCQ